jgi:hypothetical protein
MSDAQPTGMNIDRVAATLGDLSDEITFALRRVGGEMSVDSLRFRFENVEQAAFVAALQTLATCGRVRFREEVIEGSSCVIVRLAREGE